MAETNFEKDFFKLMKNLVFGKMMENIKNHRDINIMMNEKAYLKRVMKTNLKSGIIFRANLIGYEMGNIRAVMNKCIYLGQVIIDMSKIVMYEFHYDYMKLKYVVNLWLCYMDTDSPVYDIKTDNFYEDSTGDPKARFDMSNYSHSYLLPIGANKKIISLMEVKLGGRIMTEFMALRPKLYTYKILGGGGDKKCKGVKKCIMKKSLDFEDYKQCLLAGWNTFRKLLLFRNKLHKVHTIEVNKLTLTLPYLGF